MATVARDPKHRLLTVSEIVQLSGRGHSFVYGKLLPALKKVGLQEVVVAGNGTRTRLFRESDYLEAMDILTGLQK